MMKPRFLTAVQRISLIFQVSGLLFHVKMGPKWVPNRIIDDEGVRKPLERLLDGSWRHLGTLLAALGVLLERLQGRDGFKTGSVGGPAAARGGVGEGF